MKCTQRVMPQGKKAKLLYLSHLDKLGNVVHNPAPEGSEICGGRIIAVVSLEETAYGGFEITYTCERCGGYLLKFDSRLPDEYNIEEWLTKYVADL